VGRILSDRRVVSSDVVRGDLTLQMYTSDGPENESVVVN
jgi:hypothetical protein